MQQRQRIFGLQDVLALLAVISLTAVQMTGFARDPGVGWHLANGEYVLKHETVPQTDPFLFSPHPRPWISDQWLADVLLFTSYAAGAWPLVYGFLAATYLATFYAILYPMTVRLTGAPLMAATFTLLAFKLGQLHFILRPVIFGFFCFAILCALLWRREINLRTAAASKRWSVPFEIYLLPLFIVWANLHPSFVLGLLLLALRALGIALDCTARRNTATIRPPLGARIRELLCGALGSCINPNGLELHRSIVALGSDRFFMTYHEEWLPPDPTNGVGLVLLVTCLMGGISVLTERKPRSFSSFELLVFLIFGYLAFSSVRMVPFFGIVMAVPFARSVANHTFIGPTSRGWRGALRQAWLGLSLKENTRSRGIITTLIVCALLIVDPLIRGRVGPFAGPFGPPPAEFPYGAVEFLRKSATPRTPSVVVAPPKWGGFITWRGGEFVRPVIDDRNTMLGADFYREYERALETKELFKQFMIDRNATVALLPHDLSITATLLNEPEFRPVYTDATGVVYQFRPSP
jgi:hypothetical protein